MACGSDASLRVGCETAGTGMLHVDTQLTAVLAVLQEHEPVVVAGDSHGFPRSVDAVVFVAGH
jgi:hypothetical protein